MLFLYFCSNYLLHGIRDFLWYPGGETFCGGAVFRDFWAAAMVSGNFFPCEAE